VNENGDAVNSEAAVAPRRRLQAALPYLVVLAVGIFLYYVADHFEFEQASGRIGPGAWPKLILTLMLITALWGFVSTLRGGKTAPEMDVEAEEAENLIRPPEIYPYRVWLAVGATLGYLLLLPLLGFFITTIGYSFLMMYLGHFRRPVPVALLSVGIALFFMFMFMRVVYVALPLGVAPFNQVSYALMAAMGVH
jgi:putative tricarboxylic transport membrane protein